MFAPDISHALFASAGTIIGVIVGAKGAVWALKPKIDGLRRKRNELSANLNLAEVKCSELGQYKSDINGIIATLARRAGLLKDNKVASVNIEPGEVCVTNYDKTNGVWTHKHIKRRPHPQDPLAAQLNNPAAAYGPNGKAPL